MISVCNGANGEAEVSNTLPYHNYIWHCPKLLQDTEPRLLPRQSPSGELQKPTSAFPWSSRCPRPYTIHGYLRQRCTLLETRRHRPVRRTSTDGTRSREQRHRRQSRRRRSTPLGRRPCRFRAWPAVQTMRTLSRGTIQFMLRHEVRRHAAC